MLDPGHCSITGCESATSLGSDLCADGAKHAAHLCHCGRHVPCVRAGLVDQAWTRLFWTPRRTPTTAPVAGAPSCTTTPTAQTTCPLRLRATRRRCGATVQHSARAPLPPSGPQHACRQPRLSLRDSRLSCSSRPSNSRQGRRCRRCRCRHSLLLCEEGHCVSSSPRSSTRSRQTCGRLAAWHRRLRCSRCSTLVLRCSLPPRSVSQHSAVGQLPALSALQGTCQTRANGFIDVRALPWCSCTPDWYASSRSITLQAPAAPTDAKDGPARTQGSAAPGGIKVRIRRPIPASGVRSMVLLSCIRYLCIRPCLCASGHAYLHRLHPRSHNTTWTSAISTDDAQRIYT